MGRNRKIQTGASNFSASTHSATSTSTSSNNGHGIMPEVSSTLNSASQTQKIFRSSTSGMISSSDIKKEQVFKNPKNHRDLEGRMSTWRINKIDKVNYTTEHITKFLDPKDISEDKSEGKLRDMVGDEKLKAIRNAALEKMVKVAKIRFGNTLNMFKAFKKRGCDPISFSEFCDNLRKRDLENEFSTEDVRLIYDTFDTAKESVIPVNMVIQKAEELEVLDSVAKRDMMEIRAFLAAEVEKSRLAAEEFKQKKQNEKIKALHDHGKLRETEDKELAAEMKKAIGQKTFDLDVGTEELDNVLNEVFHKPATSASASKFARFLRLTNVNIAHIPFFENRQKELENLKRRAKNLEDQCLAPRLLGRLTELHDKRKDLLAQPNLEGFPEDHMTNVYNKSLKTQDSTFAGDSAFNILSPIKTSNTSRLNQPNSNNNFDATATTTNTDSVETSGSLSPTTSSPIARAREAREVGYYDTTDSHPSDFISASTVSPIRIKQSESKVLNMPPPDYRVPSKTHITYDERARIGMTMGYIDPQLEYHDRHKSISHEYLSDLYYDPIKEVSRATISDSSKIYNEKERIRNRNYDRTAANMNITKDRIEYEALKSEMRDLRASQYRNEDASRYQTTIFLNDMKEFKKMPLQVMAKKPNFTVADNMWGGRLRDPYAPEDRNFVTNYRNSYNNDQLKSSIDLTHHH